LRCIGESPKVFGASQPLLCKGVSVSEFYFLRTASAAHVWAAHFIDEERAREALWDVQRMCGRAVFHQAGNVVVNFVPPASSAQVISFSQPR
jgi:hypothetical protein